MTKIDRPGQTESEGADLPSRQRKGSTKSAWHRAVSVMLLADENAPQWPLTDTASARAVHATVSTENRLRDRAVREELESVITWKTHSNLRAPLLGGKAEARLVALCCSEPPAGRACWTPQLLADKLVGLQIVPAVSDQSVRQMLKNILQPQRKVQRCLPSQGNAAFVNAMEDVIEVYHRLPDTTRPLVSLDETTRQLLKETRRKFPATGRRPERIDYEYERNDVDTLFMMLAPHLGWRRVEVTERKTLADYARVLRELSGENFPDAEKIILVEDNLNTDDTASLYVFFAPEEARRLRERFEFHYTPKQAIG